MKNCFGNKLIKIRSTVCIEQQYKQIQNQQAVISARQRSFYKITIFPNLQVAYLIKRRFGICTWIKKKIKITDLMGIWTTSNIHTVRELRVGDEHNNNK